jgi:Phage uncharacterised protein (Phage_XkdX)
MNFLINAIGKGWATPEKAREALDLNGITVDELKQAVNEDVVTVEQYEEITGDVFKA